MIAIRGAHCQLENWIKMRLNRWCFLGQDDKYETKYQTELTSSVVGLVGAFETSLDPAWFYG